MKKQFVVKHPSQLNSMTTLPFLHKAGLGKIVFDESFEHKSREQWERDLNKNYYACGCNQSARALIFGLIIFGIGGWFGYLKYDLSITQSLVVFFVGSISMAVIGKFTGLIKANKELRQIAKEVQSVWKPKWEESEILGCG